MVLRLVAITFVSQKIESVHFYTCAHAKLSSKFLSLSPRQKETIHSSRIAFSPAERGMGEDYGVEKITKIKPSRALVASFDKFHHLCNLYIFGFCFVVA